MTDDTHDDHEEELVEVTLELEEDCLPFIDEIASDYSKKLNQDWDRGAVVRLAVGDLLSKLGKIA